MKSSERIGILGGVRIPFARQNTQYVSSSNLDMLTAVLTGIACSIGTASRFRISISMKFTKPSADRCYAPSRRGKTKATAAERWDARRRSVRSIDRAST